MHLLICIINIIVRKSNIFKIAIPTFSMNEKQRTFKAIVTAQVKLFLPLSPIITTLPSFPQKDAKWQKTQAVM